MRRLFWQPVFFGNHCVAEEALLRKVNRGEDDSGGHQFGELKPPVRHRLV
jgi:hypothetical protein